MKTGCANWPLLFVWLLLLNPKHATLLVLCKETVKRAWNKKKEKKKGGGANDVSEKDVQKSLLLLLLLTTTFSHINNVPERKA